MSLETVPHTFRKAYSDLTDEQLRSHVAQAFDEMMDASDKFSGEERGNDVAYERLQRCSSVYHRLMAEHYSRLADKVVIDSM